MAQPIETLRWRGDRLELLDQRALPQRLGYVSCATAAEVAAAIRDMIVRGAPAIGCAAAYGVALEAARPTFASIAEFYRAVDSAFGEIAASRPTAVNLFWALDRMRRVLDAARGLPPERVAA
ncbi:MAG: S-methyl-5-thioribose-1-phosphate isomerase, partial [Burkholderiales bacterium]